MITKSEYLAWRDDPVTQIFLHAIWKKREFTKEGLANAEASLEDVKRYIGQCIGLQDVLDYATKDFEYEEESE